MRLLLDTNIVIFLMTDHSHLSKNVAELLQDPENILYVSAETIREIIILFKNKGFSSKQWKTCDLLIV